LKVYTIDPLRDARWEELVGRHESSSVFHSVPWLEAIRRTYGYTPVVYTTSPPSVPLSNGVVFCQIRSWLTGRRMVSLPFSDHCEPLLDGPDGTAAIVEELRKTAEAGKWKYVELRPTSEMSSLEGTIKSPFCYLHMLDLSPTEAEIFRRTHKTSIQQRVRRAERDGIEYESGNSERLLQEFYRLLMLTRRRHQIPPQPIEWFRNLTESLGNRLQIRVASQKGIGIASIMTLLHRDVLVYKYGCSDERFSSAGATPFLMWKAIVEAKAAGATRMDFGRSDADNQGLVEFKTRWGAVPSQLTYVRWSRGKGEQATAHSSSGILKRLFAVMPDSLLQTTGRILYRHVG